MMSPILYWRHAHAHGHGHLGPDPYSVPFVAISVGGMPMPTETTTSSPSRTDRFVWMTSYVVHTSRDGGCGGGLQIDIRRDSVDW